jgi:hypothetical protein
MGGYEDNGGGWGVLAGSSIVLTEVFVLAPGLLPLVLITAVFALPFVLPLIPIAIVAGIYMGIRKAILALWRLRTSPTARTWPRA